MNSTVQSVHDHVVVFGEFSLGPAGAGSYEFTVVGADAKETGPLETEVLDASAGCTRVGPCVLACGTNVPNKGPIAVRIYECSTNAQRRLLTQLPAKRVGS